MAATSNVDRLRETILQQSRWRRLKAEEHAEDNRNAASAAALQVVAQVLDDLGPSDDLRQRISQLPDIAHGTDAARLDEEAGHFLSQIGFHRTKRPYDTTTAREDLEILANLLEQEAIEHLADTVNDALTKVEIEGSGSVAEHLPVVLPELGELIAWMSGGHGWRLGLRSITALEEVLDQRKLDHVLAARQGGASWAAIGAVLGVTPQSAHQRFATGGHGR